MRNNPHSCCWRLLHPVCLELQTAEQRLFSIYGRDQLFIRLWPIGQTQGIKTPISMKAMLQAVSRTRVPSVLSAPRLHASPNRNRNY